MHAGHGYILLIIKFIVMKNTNEIKTSGGNRFWVGVVLIFLGAVFLLDNLNFNLPGWVISWGTIFLIAGIAIGYRSNFKGTGWMILTLFGGLLTIEDILDDYYYTNDFVWPCVFIGIGLILIFKNKTAKFFDRASFQGSSCEQQYENADTDFERHNPIDVLESVNVFGGSNQRVYSKSFKGGEVVSVFGGCDVDLTQADFEGNVVIDITAIFGGCKIIVPASWEVKSELAAVFGGVEDKRALMPLTDAPVKRLTLRGVALFGGVNIRNY